MSLNFTKYFSRSMLLYFYCYSKFLYESSLGARGEMSPGGAGVSATPGAPYIGCPGDKVSATVQTHVSCPGASKEHMLASKEHMLSI